MLPPRWRKVLSDLWAYKLRTALVALSIAVGVFAVGMIAGTQVILTRDMQASYAAIRPPAAILGVSPFDEDLVQAVRRMPGVAEAEGRGGVNVRLRVGPDEWRTLELQALPDYHDIRVNVVTPELGAWPPPARAVAIERSSLALSGAAIGDTVTVELPDGARRQLRVAGTAHNINMPPAAFTGQVSGFITFETLEWLGRPRDYTSLFLTVEDTSLDRDGVALIANQVRDKVERGGYTVGYTYVPIPGKHPADSSIQPMLLILGVLGAMSLLLSGFLVVNTISAALAQQVRQIGVMKAVGGRTHQILGMYLATVLLYALLATAVAVPLAGLGAFALTRDLAALINFDVVDYRTPPDVLALEVATGLAAPLLAALWPVLSGARVTVREAISSYGLGKGRFGRSWVDRLLVGANRSLAIPRPLALSLRNTVRRKGRLALTLATLTLAGAIFMAVLSVRDGARQTAERTLFAFWQHDLTVTFERPYRAELIERAAQAVPGVAHVEPVASAWMRRVRPDGSESDNISLNGARPGNTLVRPTLLEGRWLLPEDERALVVSTDLLRDEPDIAVGDDLVLSYNDRELTWRVIGVYQGGLQPARGFTSYDELADITHQTGRAGWVQVVTERHDADGRAETARLINQRMRAQGVHVAATETADEVRGRIDFQFGILVGFLAVMALLLALVGGLGLMGTMSINVLERTREIGVMRAIGASHAAIIGIVIAEGALIGVTSWALSLLLALPLTVALCRAVGVSFIQMPLDVVFSPQGCLLWLGLVTAIGTLASVLPAVNAARLTVRDVLAYEG